MKCIRCNHIWQSQIPNPKYCPKCKSPYWNKLKVRVSLPKIAKKEKAVVENSIYYPIATEPEPDIIKMKEIDLLYLKNYVATQLHNKVKSIWGYIDDPLF